MVVKVALIVMVKDTTGLGSNMIGKRFGPDISYNRSKDIKPKETKVSSKPARKPASKPTLRDRVIQYFKKKGVYNKYAKDGSLTRRIAKGIKMAQDAEKAPEPKAKPKAKATASKSQMSPLDIPKYIRRPGELSIMPDIEVNKNASIVNQIREIARSTGLNLRISSGHRDPDKKKYQSKMFSKTSPHADKSDKDRAFDISHYEEYNNNEGGLRIVTDEEKEYISKALRAKGRRVLQEYGPTFRGKYPHLHVDKDTHHKSGHYDSSRPKGDRVIPTDLSDVKLEEDLKQKSPMQTLKEPDNYVEKRDSVRKMKIARKANFGIY